MNRALAEKLKNRLTLWKTPAGDIHADVVVNNKAQSVAVKSTTFLRSVHLLAYEAGGWVSPTDAASFAAFIEAHGHFEAPVRRADMRLVARDGALYYDIGDDTWDSVKFAGGSWSIAGRDTSPPFLRGGKTLGQTRPSTDVRSTSLRGWLSKFVTDEDRTLRLCEAWLVGAMQPGGPYPILVINGEQGSAKSTTSRLLRRLIDPHGHDLREPPTNARDLTANVKNAFVLAFDNVSHIPNWLSDSLCRIATGTGALGGRALYTDNDEAAFVACRPIILNGIPDFVEREDLADRSITIHLPSIPPSLRRDDTTFWAEVDAALPHILAALYDRVAIAHANFSSTELAEKPRMSNFARWVVAGLGPDAPDFVTILKEDRKENIEQSIEHSVLGQALIELLEERGGRYEGTILDLVRALSPKYQGSREYAPTTSLRLSNSLRRLSPVLRAAGIEVHRAGREGGTGRSRVVVCRAANPDRTYAVSAGAS